MRPPAHERPMNDRRSKLTETDAGSETEVETKAPRKARKTTAANESARGDKKVEGKGTAGARKAGKTKGKDPRPDDETDDTIVDEATEQAKEAEQAEEVEEAKEVDEEIEALEERKEEPEDPEEIERLKRKYMVRRFWQAARRFWTSQGSVTAWLLTVGLLAVIVLNIAAAYAMNVWNRNIFDALQNKDTGAVVTLSGVYVV